MEEISVSSYLSQQNLFELFRLQLKKDFESAGLDAGFTEHIPINFDELKNVVAEQLKPLGKNPSSMLNVLLYRVDVSEQQLKSYREKNLHLDHIEMLAELIIKRVLQKIILKRNFSSL